MTNEYIKVEVNFFDHAKVVDLGDTALRLHLTAIAYANRLMTDGFIATAIARRLVEPDPHGQGWGWDDHVKELLDARLWHEVEGGYRIHDFLDHNTPREARLRKRADDRDRKARERAEAKKAAQQGNGSSPQGVHTDTVDASDRTSMERPVGVPADAGAPSLAPARPTTEATVETAVTTEAAATSRSTATYGAAGAARTPPLVVVADPVTAQTLIAEHCDAVGQRPPGRELGQLARHIADMLREGIAPDLVRAGLDDYRASDLHPSVLPSLVAVRQRGGQPRARPTRQQQDRDQLVETHRQLDAWAKEVDGHAGNGMGTDRRPAQRKLPRPGAAG